MVFSIFVRARRMVNENDLLVARIALAFEFLPTRDQHLATLAKTKSEQFNSSDRGIKTEETVETRPIN